MMCWTSLQERQGLQKKIIMVIDSTNSSSNMLLLFRNKVTYLACNIRAIIPAAKGAAAEVPVCLSVHPVPVPNRQSVVTWKTSNQQSVNEMANYQLIICYPNKTETPMNSFSFLSYYNIILFSFFLMVVGSCTTSLPVIWRATWSGAWEWRRIFY